MQSQPGVEKPRVLHIGGNTPDAQLVRQALAASKRDRYEVDWVETLSAGLERLTTQRVSALLLDLQLPDSEGIDAVTRLRQAARGAPIFVVGRDEDQDIVQQVLRAGARDYLLTDRIDSYWLPRALALAIQQTRSEIPPRTPDAERHSIELGLQRALENQEFELLYQPKMDLRTGAVVGAEALIRWRHPDRGVIGPADFVPIAEDSGLVKPIGRWVVHEACRQIRAWQDAGLRPIPVSVNISATEFRSRDFPADVADVLKDTRLDPAYLEIELAERVLTAQLESTTSALDALKTQGISVAIDDFGISWSSVSRLGQFPIDTLKVDRSLVHEIVAGSHAAPIVGAIIRLGKDLNRRVVAGGVETLDQVAFLQAADCDEGQGFYFSRPVAAKQLGRLLETGTTHTADRS